MDTAVIWFLVVAVAIILTAVVLTRIFRKQSERESKLQDPNADPRDGSGIATWSGIHESGDQDWR